MTRAEDRPAFPGFFGVSPQPGISRLDYFAAAALSGLLASDPALTYEKAAGYAVHHARAALAHLDAPEAPTASQD